MAIVGVVVYLRVLARRGKEEYLERQGTGRLGPCDAMRCD